MSGQRITPDPTGGNSASPLSDPQHSALLGTAANENSVPCCEDGPTGHTEQEHHDASACFDQACPLDHPRGGPFPHPCDDYCFACAETDADHRISGCYCPRHAP